MGPKRASRAIQSGSAIKLEEGTRHTADWDWPAGLGVTTTNPSSGCGGCATTGRLKPSSRWSVGLWIDRCVSCVLGAQLAKHLPAHCHCWH